MLRLLNNSLLILLIFIFANIAYGQDLGPTYESDTDFGIEVPEELKDIHIPNNDNTNTIPTDNRPIIPPPVGGYGNLHVIIESIEAFNHSMISKKADRAEIWLGHLLLAKLDKDDVKVKDFNTSRIFDFPIMTLKSGYHFISIRLYSNGVIWKNRKFHEKIYQVGIHEGQRTTLRRKIPFLNW